MNQSEKFYQSVNVLVKAYLEGTLIQGDCAACAVGNLVAAKGGLRRVSYNLWHTPEGRHVEPFWFDLIKFPGELDGPERIQGNKQIELIGYSLAEVDAIECAFELRSFTGNSAGVDTILKGLMAVVDTLASIHGIDLTTATEAKALFVKA